MQSIQRLLQKELKEKLEGSFITLKSISDGVLMLNEEKKIVFMNSKAEVLTGWEQEELIGESLGETLELQIQEKDSSFQFQRNNELITKEGKRLPIKITTSPIKNDEGELIGVILIFRIDQEQEVQNKEIDENSEVTSDDKQEMIPALRQNIDTFSEKSQFDLLDDHFKRKLKEQDKLEKLYKIIVQMDRCQKEEAIYHLAVKAAEVIVDFSICAIYVVEEEDLMIKATSPGEVPIDFWHWSIETGVAGKTYKKRKPYLIEDLAQLNEINSSCKKYRSVISVPIGELGVFQVIAKSQSVFGQEDVRLLELLAVHVNEVLQRLDSEQKVEYLNFHDNLTDLYNRAYFEDALKRLDTQRQLPLSVIMGDVNGLKLTNDAFGHKTGDKLLKQVAQVLQNSCRKEDIIARWGGDEFAILLPKTSSEIADKVIERIKKACNELKINSIQISISLGKATKSKMEEDISQILKRAENAMYKNKLNQSKQVKERIISSLEKKLRKKDYETWEHIQRLQKLAFKMGQKLRLSKSKLKELLLLVNLHDIGQTAIDDEILLKKNELSEEEWEIVQSHPKTGYHIIKSSSQRACIVEEVLSHHEWWDGTGYPRGLAGEEIPFLARILAIIDAYDVMTRGRPYKERVTKQEALAELKKCAGSQFDPELVEKFIEMMNS